MPKKPQIQVGRETTPLGGRPCLLIMMLWPPHDSSSRHPYPRFQMTARGSESPTTKDQVSNPGLSGPRAQDFSPPPCCAPQQGTQAEEHRDRQSTHLHRASGSTVDSYSHVKAAMQAGVIQMLTRIYT